MSYLFREIMESILQDNKRSLGDSIIAAAKLMAMYQVKQLEDGGNESVCLMNNNNIRLRYNVPNIEPRDVNYEERVRMAATILQAMSEPSEFTKPIIIENNRKFCSQYKGDPRHREHSNTNHAKYHSH